MGHPDPTGIAFNALMEKVSQKIEEARQKVVEFFNAVGKVLSKLPGILARGANSLLNKVRDKWNQLMDKIRFYWNHRGDPGRLNAAAKRYSDDVQAKVSPEANVYRPSGLVADDKWKGDAADAYREILLPQGTALGAYADKAGKVGSTLRDAGWAIYIFWGAVAAAVAVLIIGIIGAIAAAETVIGAIGAILAALVVAAAAIGTGLLVAQDKMSTAAAAFRTEANDKKAFPGPPPGSWPRATRSLLDGTTRP